MSTHTPALRPAASLSRAEQRRLIASTPPPTPWLSAHPHEDLAVRTLMRTPPLILGRIDDPGRRSSDLPEEHHGAVRLFDRGLIRLLDYSLTHTTWTWTSLNAHADGTRMLRHRTLGFLPYNLGYRERTPATMTGPELVAMLVWHYRHSTVRHLWIRAEAGRVAVKEGHHDSPPTTRSFAPVPEVLGYRDQTSTIPAHLDDPDRRWEPSTLDAFLTNLAVRVAPVEFGEPRLTVNLTNWHLDRYDYTPATFTETLPLDVQDALTTLSAPIFTTAAEFVAWTETGLTLTVLCKIDDAGMPGRQHTLRLDPHTHAPATIPAKDPKAAEALAAMHLLHAFGVKPEPRCVVAGRAWASNGLVSTGQQSWSPTQTDRVLAIHRIARAVQQVDAGFDFALLSPVVARSVTLSGSRVEARRAAVPKSA